MTMGDGSSNDIDEDLHSQQLAVYGRETMRRLFGASVLISGINGLSAEILILAGVKFVTVHDEGTVELWTCLGTFFSLSQMWERIGPFCAKAARVEQGGSCFNLNSETV